MRYSVFQKYIRADFKALPLVKSRCVALRFKVYLLGCIFFFDLFQALFQQLSAKTLSMFDCKDTSDLHNAFFFNKSAQICQNLALLLVKDVQAVIVDSVRILITVFFSSNVLIIALPKIKVIIQAINNSCPASRSTAIRPTHCLQQTESALSVFSSY